MIKDNNELPMKKPNNVKKPHICSVFFSYIEFIQYEEIVVFRSRRHYPRGLPSISFCSVYQNFGFVSSF